MASVIAVTRFAVPADGSFETDARSVLLALSAQAGFVRGRLARAVDEQTSWSLVTEWDTVGSYRRGLGAYDVKLATAPLLAWSVLEPSTFEVLMSIDERRPSVSPTDRAR